MRDKEKKVLEIINVRKILSVSDICEELKVSESTARRILISLSDRKLIHRFHGGGQSLAITEVQADIQRRMQENAKIKDSIAKRAAAEIKNGQTVILLGGTTVYMMCKYIVELRITVITNSLIVFEALKNAKHLNLILLGGHYNKDEMEVQGALTNAGLRLINADSLFMGATGLNPRVGFLTDEIDAIDLYRLCIDATKQRYVLADGSKLQGLGSAVIASYEHINTMITNNDFDREIAKEYSNKGVDVIFS